MKRLLLIFLLLACMGCTARDVWQVAWLPINSISPAAGLAHTGASVAFDVVAPFYEPTEEAGEDAHADREARP